MKSAAAAVRPAPVRAGVLLAAAVLVASNLRTALASIPALIPAIQDDLGISGAVAGALTTLPVLAMGLCAPPASRLAARIGRERAVSVGLVILLAGLLLRVVPTTLVLLAATLLGGVGIAVVGTLMPGLVKEFFPDRVGAVTGFTMAAMMLGASASSALAVPLMDLSGSWSVSAAAWSVLALAALVVWVPVQRRIHEPPLTLTKTALPWRSRTAWLAATYLSANSLLFYSMLTWLAPAFEDRGWSAASSGLLLSLFGLVQLVTGFAVPAVSDRMADHRPLFAVVLGSVPVGLAAVLLAPTWCAPLSVAVLGFGLGGGFTMGLVLLADYAPDPQASARLSGMAFLVSYTVASAGPLAVGALRDASGGFGLPFTLLLGVSVAVLALVPRLRPGRLVTSPGTPAGPPA